MQLSQLENAVFTSSTWFEASATIPLPSSTGRMASASKSATPLLILLSMATSIEGIVGPGLVVFNSAQRAGVKSLGFAINRQPQNRPTLL